MFKTSVAVAACSMFGLAVTGTAATGELSPDVIRQADERAGEMFSARQSSLASSIGSLAQARQAACGRRTVRIQNLRAIDQEPYDQIRFSLRLCRGQIPMVLANIAIRNEEAPGVAYQFVTPDNHRIGVTLFKGEQGSKASFFYIKEDVTVDSGRSIANAGTLVAGSGRIIQNGHVSNISVPSFNASPIVFRSDERSLGSLVRSYGLGVSIGPLGIRNMTSEQG